ncbi:MAG TPA: HDOD domain-containing protein [Gammaproteobacteria bacterium]|nr:HDOD domain-containing protein [Gammaproteobacteria bacterium]
MSADLKNRLLAQLIDDMENDKLVLPSLPEVALKVRDTLDDENANARDVARVIGTDAALSARLIAVANSPLLRGSRHIDSVDMAVARMGNTIVRNTVNSLIVQQIFQPTTEITDRLFRSFWEHSTEVAAISQALAGFARLKPDQAMLAGLVHDIGALPIVKYAEDIPQLLEHEQVLIEIIQELHTTIGTALLSKWEFPQDIINVAAKHEDLGYQHDGAADLVDVVIVANLQSYFGKNHPHAKVKWDTVPAFATLGMDTEVSIIDMEETGESIREVADALRA